MSSSVGFFSGLIKPFGETLDALFTSDEERLRARHALRQLEITLAEREFEFEQVRLREQSQNVRSETQGQSWLQRNWRPLTMLTFLVLIVLDTLGWVMGLPQDVWLLMEIGLGGYVIGRSAEKIVPGVAGIVRDLRVGGSSVATNGLASPQSYRFPRETAAQKRRPASLSAFDDAASTEEIVRLPKHDDDHVLADRFSHNHGP